MESFYNVICAAAANQKKIECKNVKSFSTKISEAKKSDHRPKGKMAAGVKAFLERQQAEEQKKMATEQKRKAELLQKRKGANNMKKAKAMTNTTKDNRKTFTEDELKRARAEAQERAQRVAEALKLGKRAPQRMVGLKHTKTAQELKTDEFIDDALSSSEDEDSFKVLTEEKEKTIYKGSKHNKYKEKEREKRRQKERREKMKANGGYSTPTDRHKDKHKKRHKDKHKSDKKDKEKREKIKRREEFKKRQEKARSGEGTSGKEEKTEEPAPRPKIKPRFNKPMPPPMSFEQLMSMAADGKNPTTNGGSGSSKPPPAKKKKVADRPMTAEEKESHRRRQSKEYQRWLKFGGERPNFSKDSESDSDSDNEKPVVKNNASPPMNNGSSRNNRNDNGSKSNNNPKKHTEPASTSQSRPFVPKGGYSVNPKSIGNIEEARRKRAESNRARPADKDDSAHNNVLVCKPAKPEPELSAWDRIYGQRQKKSKAPPPRQRIESESDYDSYEDDEYDDMDGFIDDGDAETDVSSAIKDIFGYDKNKYKNERLDDLGSMETSFSTQMAEERYSAKMGMKEDAEDIKMEEQHKKRKMALKKMAAKRHR